MPAISAVPFVTRLGAHGDRLAVVTTTGESLTYRQLDARVESAAAELGGARRLVLVAGGNAIEPLVSYLGALRAGHPVLLADPARTEALTAAYDPDVVCGPAPDGRYRIAERRAGTAHDLHPELALLLSTSGSTGSPKLVRLSADGMAANAAAIGEYLDIKDTDRAAATLPLHYCYGLSVAHSNLARGAALLLSDLSVTDPRFWAEFRAHEGTSLHGVPYTFELLDGVGFADMDLPHLRYVTQAGGRLPPDVVRRYAELGERRGWRLFVMYGQTEATARMAYLPPQLASRSPSAIGRPVPGGSLTIEGGAEVGELVYRGPNVMLGYARTPADLALGRTVSALRTGDLGRLTPDGMFEIVGRTNRFIKPYGIRVDLDDAERLLAEEGCTAACAGDDTELVVVVAGDPEPTAVRGFLARRTGLPARAIRVVPVQRLPRRANGKIDYAAVSAITTARPHLARLWRRRRGPRSVREVFRSAFPLQDLPDDATFTHLGGDSLTYVQVSVGLQRVLGHLPRDWPDLPLASLTELGVRRRWWTTVETPVVLRAVAIVLVVGSHIGLFRLLGGSHVLLAAAGWAFARFALTPRCTGSPTTAVLHSAARIAVPSALWILARSAMQDDLQPANALLLNYLIEPSRWGYWYVETLCQALVLLALVFAIPGVRQLERAHPFGFALTGLAVALTGRLLPDDGNEFTDRMMSLHIVLWIFMLGWVACRADTPGQRLLTATLVVLLVPGSFGEPLRELVIVTGLLLLLAPRLPVPRVALAPLGAVAAASLAIYLTHYALYPHLLGSLPAEVVLAGCIASGVLTHRAVGLVQRRLLPALRRRRAPSHRGSPHVKRAALATSGKVTAGRQERPPPASIAAG